MSSPSERERRLSGLARKLGHELDEDFRRAGNRLRDVLIRDFDKEMSLAEVFADRNDLIEAAYSENIKKIEARAVELCNSCGIDITTASDGDTNKGRSGPKEKTR